MLENSGCSVSLKSLHFESCQVSLAACRVCDEYLFLFIFPISTTTHHWQNSPLHALILQITIPIVLLPTHSQ